MTFENQEAMLWKYVPLFPNRVKFYFKAEQQNFVHKYRRHSVFKSEMFITNKQSTVPYLLKKLTAFYKKTQINYCVHSSLPLAPAQSKINPAHVPLSYLFCICFNIILSSIPGYQKCL